MQNKMFLVDAQHPSTPVHPYINESNTIADHRHTRYAEGDLLLEIIKESMVARHIGIGSYRSHDLSLQSSESVNAKV